MPPTYAYPTDDRLMEIDRVFMADMTLADPIFQLFPVVPTQDHRVTWDQEDNYYGLMQIRGLNGDPRSVPQLGAKRYSFEPGVYGEFDSIDEQQIVTRAPYGMWSGTVDIGDLVERMRNKLLVRQVQRMKWVLYSLVINGVYRVLGPTGAVVQEDSYPVPLYTAPVLWSNQAGSGPLADFRAVQLMGRGQSANFGPNALALMNQKTFNYYIWNTNANDLGGKKGVGLQSISGLQGANQLQSQDGLPRLMIHDDGYYDDAKAWQQWIPDGYVIVAGTRNNNARVGDFALTRNPTNPGNSSQPYVKVVDIGAGPNEPPPRRVQVHRGFNGGPRIFYPGSIVIMKVA